MSMPHLEETIELLVPELIAEGFEVLVRPDTSLLPDQLKSHRPDVIAMRAGEKVAVYVLRRDEESKRRLIEAQSAISTAAGWKIRSIWLNLAREAEIPAESPATLKRSLGSAMRLLTQGDAQAALLVAFSTFEAVGRVLVPSQFGRPQVGKLLVEGMAHHGWVTPDEANLLRHLWAIRSRIAHGGLSTDVEAGLVKRLIEITEALVPQNQVGQLEPVDG